MKWSLLKYTKIISDRFMVEKESSNKNGILWLAYIKSFLIISLLASLFLSGFSLAQQDSNLEKDDDEENKADVDVKSDNSVPEEIYIVKQGDTLWDISSQYLGSPWYWPKVWSYNPEIANPHWIYPGNRIRFMPGEGQDKAEDEGKPAPNASDLALSSSRHTNHFDSMGQDNEVVKVAFGAKLGFSSKKRIYFNQDTLVSHQEMESAGVIENSFAEKEMLSNYDKVYLKFKNLPSIKMGQVFPIYRTIDEITHPVTHKKFGYLTRVVGALRTLSVHGSKVSAIIEQTNEEISRGDFIGPLGILKKRIIPKESNQKLEGVVVTSRVPVLPIIGEQHVVFIDKGSRDGVEEGTIFRVMRQGDPLRPNDDPKKFPLEATATMVVLDVKENSSSGLVVNSAREVVVGDKVVTQALIKSN